MSSFLLTALGLAFVPLGSQGLEIDAIKFKFNMYTGPGYLSALLGLVIIILLIFVFRETNLTKANKEKEQLRKADEYGNSSTQSERIKGLFTGTQVVMSYNIIRTCHNYNHADCFCCRRQLPSALGDSSATFSSVSSGVSAPLQKPFDKVAAAVNIFLFFITLFVFSVFETLGSPLSMDEFAWNKKQAVLYNNLLYVGLSVISILAYIVVKILAKKYALFFSLHPTLSPPPPPLLPLPSQSAPLSLFPSSCLVGVNDGCTFPNFQD